MDTQHLGEGKWGIWQTIGIVVLILVSLSLFYITIPAAIIWYLYWKNKTLPIKTKHIIAASIVGLVVVGAGIVMYTDRTPTLAITSPQDGVSVQAATTTIEGIVTPSEVDLTINGIIVPIKDGKFSYIANLRNETNIFRVQADNTGNMATTTLTINRVFTPAELAQRVADQKKAEAEAAAQKAQEQAALNAYYQTRAGRLCKAHPEWTKDECQNIADGKIWIGMSRSMLFAELGQPDSTNVSNYGGGNRYQYCWSGSGTTCFYDNDNDGIIDAYN